MLSFAINYMYQLDLKDKKILYELEKNSRQSFSQIGKRVGLHRNNVIYKVNNLIKNGIIRDFYTVIDSYALGYTFYRFYINFQDINPEIKKEIINYFVMYSYTTDVHETDGQYDLIVIIAVNNVRNFYNFWQKTLIQYGNYFEKQLFSIYCSEKHYDYNFLVDDNKKFQIKNYKIKKSYLFSSIKKNDIDYIDVNILRSIAPNARKKIIEISKELNISTVTVQKRINRLKELGIIHGFTIGINFPSIGYKIFKVDINLKNKKIIYSIIRYLESNPNLIGLLHAVGYEDLELMFILQNSGELHDIMEDILIKFPEGIKKYFYFSVTRTYKWIYMT